jgi:hypothetical protein
MGKFINSREVGNRQQLHERTTHKTTMSEKSREPLNNSCDVLDLRPVSAADMALGRTFRTAPST